MSPIHQAIVLAAGEGRRLLPITRHTPKPLIPFYGRPLLDWAVEKLVRADIQRIAVNAHHLADQVAARVEVLAGRHPGVGFHLSPEATLLGTGGAVRNLRDWLTPGEPFLVLNADALFEAEAGVLASAPGAAALLVTREPSYAAWRRLLAGDDHRLSGIAEGGDPDGFTFCGFTRADPELPSRLPDGPSCILRQGFLPYLDALDVRLVETPAFFADTGTPDALIDAHMRGYRWVSAYQPI